jgi:1-acyl-sn-glycerol-3-phosphate acyltransferase
MIAAPHTTNWDFYYMRIAFLVLGIPMKATIKDFWTQFPFGLIIKPLGGLGINRRPKNPNEPRKSYVEQMASFFDEYDKIAMVVAAEGTRSLVTEWKLGFYHTAKLANVPITFGYLDFKKKEAGVGGAIYPTDDMEADLKKVMEFYKNIAPKYPEKFSLDLRYA